MFGKQYLVPRADGRVLVGSTEEPEAGFEKANTAEARRGADSPSPPVSVPGLASAELEVLERPAAGHEGRFAVHRSGAWLGTMSFVAAGHFRAGVQLSIGTGQVITELFTGKPTCVSLEAFAVDRPPT